MIDPFITSQLTSIVANHTQLGDFTDPAFSRVVAYSVILSATTNMKSHHPNTILDVVPALILNNKNPWIELGMTKSFMGLRLHEAPS